MSARLFSVTRRRPHVVDIYTPAVNPDIPTQVGYRLKAAPNFDDVMTTIITLPQRGQGFLDPAVDQRILDIQGSPNRVRIVFDPDTFSSGQPIDAGIADDKPFWLQFFPLDSGGGEIVGAEGAPTLVLPDSAAQASNIITVSGEAPQGADVTESLQLDFPRLVTEFVVTNEESAMDLYVSTVFEGPETKIAGGAPPAINLSYEGNLSSVWVRGQGAPAEFSMTCTFSFPK